MEGKTVCFSGHRPTKLPCHDESSPETNRLKSMLYKAIYDCVEEGYTNFVTGLAKGIDNWAADMVIEFKIKQLMWDLIGRNHKMCGRKLRRK